MSVSVLGSINMDVVLSVQELPLPGETISAQSRSLYPGGKGANQAIASARCGVETSITGAVGDDEFGRTLWKNLSDNKVGIEGLQTLAGTETGQASIYVAASGENSIVVLPGANHVFRMAETVSGSAGEYDVRLTQFEMPLEAIGAFLAAEPSSKGFRIINPAPAILEGKALFDLAELIIVNETELAVYSNQPLDEQASADELDVTARTLLSRPNQWVVVTLGSKGAVAVSLDDKIRISGHPVAVVDTTGAGDCFCGALAASLSEGRSVREAMRFANAAASFAVTKHGAGPSMPFRRDVVDHLEHGPTD
jgi:ribokinase